MKENKLVVSLIIKIVLCVWSIIVSLIGLFYSFALEVVTLYMSLFMAQTIILCLFILSDLWAIKGSMYK